MTHPVQGGCFLLKMTPENGAFIYPDFETVLLGTFNAEDNTLIEAFEATIKSVRVNSFGIMEPSFDEIPNGTHFWDDSEIDTNRQG